MFTVKIMTSGAAFRDDSSGQVDASGNYPLASQCMRNPKITKADFAKS